MFLARVRVNSQYFPVLYCIIIQLRNKEIVAVAVVRVSSGFLSSVWMYIVQYTRRTCFSLGLVLAVSIFQFWIVYHTVAQGRYRGSRCG